MFSAIAAPRAQLSLVLSSLPLLFVRDVPLAPGAALVILLLLFAVYHAAAASCARRAFYVGRGAGALVLALAARRASAPPRAVGRRGLGAGCRAALPILLFVMLPLLFVLWYWPLCRP